MQNKTSLITGIVILLVLAAGYFFFVPKVQAPDLENAPALKVPAPGFENVPEIIAAPEQGPGEEFAEPPVAPPFEKPSVQEVRTIAVKSGFLFFEPNTLTLKKGEPARIVFQNSGGHTFTVDELAIHVPLNGSSAVFEFTPDKIGTFEFYCAIPGHRFGGMKGTLTVE